MLETIDTQNNATSKQGVAVGCNQGLMVVSQDAKIPYLYLLERKIQEEIGNNNLLEHISQNLNHYIQELEDTEQMDLQGKLNLASREKELFIALRLKEKVSKLIDKYSLFASANKYLTYIFAMIIHLFKTYVYPEICAEKNLFEIKKVVSERVIIPVSEEIQKGENYFDLNYEDIEGMIYFLAGNCHIWFDKEHTEC